MNKIEISASKESVRLAAEGVVAIVVGIGTVIAVGIAIYFCFN